MKAVLFIAGLLLWALASTASAQPASIDMAPIEGGIFHPFYPPSPKEKEIPVKSFWLDKQPVTNADFSAFVNTHPEWRRDRIKRLFADQRYLSHWNSPTTLGPNAKPLQPVTQVSWFAAKAYCEAREARLPTENEWEYAASASQTERDARFNMTWRNQVLDWYSRPAPPELPSVRQTLANYWGVFDLHGLVWEWVLDFNSSLISSDNRENAESPDKNRFCGAGAQVATEKDDYASFMRLAFRNSLKATYTTTNLGFRCAKERIKS